jgi:hypothetical protein
MSYTWSFSSLKDYLNCPRQYHEVKVLRNFTKPATKEMLYGSAVHKACEDYVGADVPLAKNYEQFKPLLDTLKDIPGVRYLEHQMALDKDKNVCSYGKGYWVRGIVDFMVVDGDTAHIIDYKTGSSKYADPKQLRLMALMAFASFPEVQTIKAALLFIVRDGFTEETYKRDDIPTLWEGFHKDLKQLDVSYDTGVWNPKSTPLCGYCPVKTCEYHKER